MPALRALSVVLVFLATLGLAPSLTRAAHLQGYHSDLEARYAHAHSLGDGYLFDPRDGWESVNVTDLQYKYNHRMDDDEPGDSDPDDEEWDSGDDGDEVIFDLEHSSGIEKRAAKKKSQSKAKAKAKSTSKSKPKSKSKSKSHSSSKAKTSSSKAKTSSSKAKAKSSGVSLSNIVESIKGIGKAEPVVITWYTGHDLLNPSCWSNPTWAPTDGSFAAALTLEGWTTKPKCFKFLELCNSPKKCVFVRVVDSCAGCAKGSKHVDLTQAAFKELADLDKGLLSVQMREATDPNGWLENLWGPKH